MLRPTPRTGTRRAAIDVGTNSVKLLVADVGDARVDPVEEASRVTRLGRDFYGDRRLRADAITETAAAVAEFTRRAHDAGACSLRVIGTSAAREAENAGDLAAALRTASGQNLEIVSGEQEAEWAYAGVTSDAAFATGPLLIMDVGGGSTELILGMDGHSHWRRSFPLGVVRLLETLHPADPPVASDLPRCREEVRAFIEQHIAGALSPQLAPDTRLVGVGGTATVLAAMELELRQFDRGRLQGFALAREKVAARVGQLWSLPLAARGTLPGLPPKRADVILTGAVIYQLMMEWFGFDECRVSTRGLRYAAVLEVA